MPKYLGLKEYLRMTSIKTSHNKNNLKLIDEDDDLVSNYQHLLDLEKKWK